MQNVFIENIFSRVYFSNLGIFSCSKMSQKVTFIFDMKQCSAGFEFYTVKTESFYELFAFGVSIQSFRNPVSETKQTLRAMIQHDRVTQYLFVVTRRSKFSDEPQRRWKRARSRWTLTCSGLNFKKQLYQKWDHSAALIFSVFVFGA